MPNQNVTLTDHNMEFIAQQLESGRYNSISEVVRNALRILERQEQIEEAKLEAVRRDVQAGANA